MGQKTLFIYVIFGKPRTKKKKGEYINEAVR